MQGHGFKVRQYRNTISRSSREYHFISQRFYNHIFFLEQKFLIVLQYVERRKTYTLVTPIQLTAPVDLELPLSDPQWLVRLFQ